MNFISFFFKAYLFMFERESTTWEGVERDGKRGISSRLPAVSMGPSIELNSGTTRS